MFYNKNTGYVHFIGIGGIGMSAMAEVLLGSKILVSGSDVYENARVVELKKMGAKISIGHTEENIHDETSVVVYSSAVNLDNIEIKEAIRRKCPILKRAEMLYELMRLKHGLAIAGTHGKTTTTSMLATILIEANMDPTFIIGGIVHNLGSNAHVGKGDFVVVEADESDGSFLHLAPIYSAITNIDNDHLDHYQSQKRLLDSFIEFANKIPFYGKCIINTDDINSKLIINKIKRPIMTVGIESKAQLRAKEIQFNRQGSQFVVTYLEKRLGVIQLNQTGRHNILNALGAISLAMETGVSFELIQKGLRSFKGVGRRFEKIYENDFCSIIDDYAHHPTEISATIDAVKNISRKDIVVVFEPHRYSRTSGLWEQFLDCFSYAKKVYLLEVYPAGERPIESINSTILATDINKRHPDLAQQISSGEELERIIKGLIKSECEVLTLGAGSIGQKIRQIVGKF